VIRLFAYEVPLESASRGDSIDLLGYDNVRNLYIFELKNKKSTEKLSDVNKQIERYAHKLKGIKKYIEGEFNQTFFFTVEFREIRKMVVAPLEFYKAPGDDYKRDIEYLYYADGSVFEKADIPQNVRLHVWKKNVKRKCN